MLYTTSLLINPSYETNVLTLYHNYKSNISHFLYSLHNPHLIS
ncbi:hypothetical protein AMTRI_Chr09g15340 [Amborella trichopoda]